VCCKHALLGCEKKMIRREMKVHEEDQEGHLSLALTSITDLKNRVLVLESQREVESLTTIKMSCYNTMRRNNTNYKSKPFFTSPNGFRLRSSVYPNGLNRGKGTHVSVFLQVLNGPFDSYLLWPLTGTFEVELLNQLEDKNHHKELINFADDNCNVPGGSGWGCPLFVRHSKLQLCSSSNTQYLKDDNLYFRISLLSGIPSKPWLDYTSK